MDVDKLRVMFGDVSGSFRQWGMDVQRASMRPSLAPRRQRGVCVARCTEAVLSLVAIWMGLASAVHVGDDGAVSSIADPNLVAGAAI